MTAVHAADGYADLPSLYFSWPAGGHVVALTFDDDNAIAANIGAIVDILEAEDVAATFFPTGDSVIAVPDVWRRIAAAGFPIGNHSLSHPDLTTRTYPTVLNELTEWRRIT